MSNQPAARTVFVLASAIILLSGLGNVARAAIPTNSATITVSATVLPACNDTSCRDIPRVVSYAPANGLTGAPAFGLVSDNRSVMTITY